MALTVTNADVFQRTWMSGVSSMKATSTYYPNLTEQPIRPADWTVHISPFVAHGHLSLLPPLSPVLRGYSVAWQGAHSGRHSSLSDTDCCQTFPRNRECSPKEPASEPPGYSLQPTAHLNFSCRLP